jgi:small subunit ribosomal protein S13
MAIPEKQEKVDSNFKYIVRIVNVDLPGNQQIRFSLTNIKGIGINLADSICKVTNVKGTTKTGNLSDAEIEKLNQFVANLSGHGVPSWMFNRRKDYDEGTDKHLITGTLTFVHDNDLKRLKKIKSLRGLRHQMGLPVRGQRTRAHFRKHKGKVVGVTKKKVAPEKSDKSKK